MEISEDKAKSILEAIVEDLNRRFGFKLYVTSKRASNWNSSSKWVSVHIIFRDKYDNREWCFATATTLNHPEHLYLQLLHNIIARPNRGYFTYGIEKRIDIARLYGKTIEEVCIAVDLMAC